ncbi:hypothetical protein VCUG_00751 [Vavraia culicis subsp. floridensis]|uniref:Uncharacterized protein n=1 Tax=Vavraia culicis (isolate floridensis) TaxID=948595 RepID=L2GXF8_VAVCU|nr:uncharacterized protein VCUG_00751 [Vavraia culicis subsp. floridensis]ELA47790.1 hypothetical protein VCUG_00751 [Vavraia culicis subsp. floridensis]
MNPFTTSLLYTCSIVLIITVHFAPPRIAQTAAEHAQKQLKIRFNELYDAGAMEAHTHYYHKLKKVIRYSHFLHARDVHALFIFSEMNDMRIDAMLSSLDFRSGGGFRYYLPPLFNFGIWFPLLCPVIINMVVVLKTFIRRCSTKQRCL